MQSRFEGIRSVCEHHREACALRVVKHVLRVVFFLGHVALVFAHGCVDLSFVGS